MIANFYSSNRIKSNYYSITIPIVMIIMDCAFIFASMGLISSTDIFYPISEQEYILIIINMALCWSLAGLLTGFIPIENNYKEKNIVLRGTAAAAGYYVLVYLATWFSGENIINSNYLIFLCFVTALPIIISRKLLLNAYMGIKHMAPNRKNTIIIGSTPRGKELAQYFGKTRLLSQQYLGFFDDNLSAEEQASPSYLGTLSDVEKYCIEHHVREIYYASNEHKEFFEGLKKFADNQFIFLGIIPEVDVLDFGHALDTVLVFDNRIPVITPRKIPLQFEVNWYFKRAFDIAFSIGVLLILAFTLFPVIALAIKLSSPGPIFFRQLRPGKNNKLFWCYKFRTMMVNNEEQKQASRNDSRITKVGSFLRKSSLDELPQFLNVLIGDMSVVGPRPNLVVHLETYPTEIKEYPLRHWVTPGITGYAQISGFRGETRETILMQRRVDHDLFYIERWSLWLDLKIIFKTVLNMVKGEDTAY